MAWNRKYIILLDGNKAGLKAKDRYMKEFGESVKSNIVTFLDVDSNLNFPTENLFTTDERLSITKQFDLNALSFDKSKFNTSIQNLYSTKQLIKLGDTTIANFEKIFNTLKEKM